MISLHVTLYTGEDGDKFRVNAVDDQRPEMLHDVTDQYDVVAMETEDGRSGFAVLKKLPAEQQAGD